MAKKVAGFIKLQIPAGKATPAPPVGPALGQHGVNIMEFVKQFNEKTAKQVGLVSFETSRFGTWFPDSGTEYFLSLSLIHIFTRWSMAISFIASLLHRRSR